MDALSSRDSIGEKLLRSKLSKPKMVFADFDGTLFTPNWKLLADPFFNTRISYLLRQQHIPLVIVTGRSGWTGIDIKQLFFLGIPSPDGAITANGTIIYTRIADTYQRDVVWEGMMQSSKVSFQDNTIHPWNKLEITTILRTHLQSQPIRFVIKTGNTYLIRIQVNKFPVNKLIEIKKSILALFPKGIKVVFTEKLLWENTQNLFSGDILITPTLGGKENAVKYLLEKYSSQISSQLLVHSSQNKITNNQSPITNNQLHAFVFGDATVDIGMLTLKDNPKYYTVETFGVHLTPLAKKSLLALQKTNPQLHITDNEGPQTILQVLKESKGSRDSKVFKQELRVKNQELGEFQIERSQQLNNRTMNEPEFSPAQNSKARNFIRYLEPLLDKIIDKKLTPNEVSLLGLEKFKKGIDQLYGNKKQSHPKDGQPLAEVIKYSIQKLYGFGNFAFGNLTDMLDGIRARRSTRHSGDERSEDSLPVIPAKAGIHPTASIGKNGSPIGSGMTNSVPGQLMDGFCDRAKEFYQLYVRAIKRFDSYSSSDPAQRENRPACRQAGKFQGDSSRLRQVPNGTWLRSNNKDDSQEKAQQKGFITFLAALSTCLPSIARAQAEIRGIIVPEQDIYGGSMLNRTKNLSISLLYDLLGKKDKSFQLDQKVYSASMATFENRLIVIPAKAGIQGKDKNGSPIRSGMTTGLEFVKSINLPSLDTFEMKALERWLFYIEILQEEDEIVEFFLRQYPKEHSEYKKFQRQISFYLKLNIEKYRKKWDFKNYNLFLKKLL